MMIQYYLISRLLPFYFIYWYLVLLRTRGLLFQPKSSTNHIDLYLLLEGLHSLSTRQCRSCVYLYDGSEKLLAC